MVVRVKMMMMCSHYPLQLPHWHPSSLTLTETELPKVQAAVTLIC